MEQAEAVAEVIEAAIAAGHSCFIAATIVARFLWPASPDAGAQRPSGGTRGIGGAIFAETAGARSARRKAAPQAPPLSASTTDAAKLRELRKLRAVIIKAVRSWLKERKLKHRKPKQRDLPHFYVWGLEDDDNIRLHLHLTLAVPRADAKELRLLVERVIARHVFGDEAVRISEAMCTWSGRRLPCGKRLKHLTAAQARRLYAVKSLVPPREEHAGIRGPRRPLKPIDGRRYGCSRPPGSGAAAQPCAAAAPPCRDPMLIEIPIDADDETLELLIDAHRRATGYFGPVFLTPPVMTPTAWERHFAYLAV